MDKRRINVRAIIWHEEKLLAVKHKTKQGGEAAYWALPGGGLDPYESLTEGIERELVEETGVTPHVGRLLFGQQLRSSREGRDEELELFFLVTNAADYLDVDIANTTHGAEELARCEFIDPASEYVLPDFLSSIDIASYVQTVQPVHFASYLNT